MEAIRARVRVGRRHCVAVVVAAICIGGMASWCVCGLAACTRCGAPRLVTGRALSRSLNCERRSGVHVRLSQPSAIRASRCTPVGHPVESVRRKKCATWDRRWARISSGISEIRRSDGSPNNDVLPRKRSDGTEPLGGWFVAPRAMGASVGQSKLGESRRCGEPSGRPLIESQPRRNRSKVLMNSYGDSRLDGRSWSKLPMRWRGLLSSQTRPALTSRDA